MTAATEQIIGEFKRFVEAGLVEHNTEKALSIVAEDIIGIGMGEQGIVTCKEDAARILGDGKSDSEKNQTEIEYVSLQARCYEERYGTVCGVLKVKVRVNEKIITSTLGQIINFRRQDDRWLIYALQATPIFEQIEELEAYPIKFAENVLETYRQQEQLAQNAQNDSIAVYQVDFTRGVFLSAVLKSDLVIQTEKGDAYEKVLFDSSRRHLKEDDGYRFISAFSLGNIMRAYEQGQTEVSLEYETFVSKHKSVWMKTVIRLYTDKTDEHLKGYLYVIDIDKSKRREQELESRAELDSLTQIYNKKNVEAKIREKLNEAVCPDEGVFYIMDLDYFKNINDTYGHQEGDRIISETAKCITSLTGKGDVAGRIGGDEFCVYFHEKMEIESIAEKAGLLCRQIRNLIPLKENGTSCSIGIVNCAAKSVTFEEVYRKADLALYRQKKNGRNGFTIYSEDLEIKD